jgi:hypothetical protein
VIYCTTKENAWFVTPTSSIVIFKRSKESAVDVQCLTADTF